MSTSMSVKDNSVFVPPRVSTRSVLSERAEGEFRGMTAKEKHRHLRPCRDFLIRVNFAYWIVFWGKLLFTEKYDFLGHYCPNCISDLFKLSQITRIVLKHEIIIQDIKV